MKRKETFEVANMRKQSALLEQFFADFDKQKRQRSIAIKICATVLVMLSIIILT